MTSKPTSSPRRTQAERTDEARTALIDAAVEIIASRGLAGVTLSDVGAKAGYSRGLAVYHFGSKTGLILAVFDHVRDIGASALRRFSRNQVTPGNKLISLFDAIADTAVKGPAVYRATTAMLIDGALSPDPAIRARTMATDELAMSVIRSMVDGANFAPGTDKESFARAIANSIYGVQMRAYLLGDRLDVRDEFNRLKSLAQTFLSD